MKKLLLLAAVAVSAMTANAQVLSFEQMKKVPMQKSIKAEKMAMPQVDGPRKNVVDGVYYTRPQGSFGYGWDKEGSGYYSTFVVVPPYKEFELVNQSTSVKGTTWTWGGEDASDMVKDGNFVWEQSGASGYYLPTLTKKTVEYTWGVDDNVLNGYSGQKSAMYCQDAIAPLTLTDPHLGPDYIGWGYISSNFLFGDGKLEVDGKTLQTFAAVQDFPAPMSPLYVEDIYMRILNFDSETFLKDGEELQLDIVNADNEVLYTLTAGPDDITIEDEGEPYTTEYGDMRFAQAVFTMKDVDPLTGDVAAVPFVLDQAFTAIISGFEGKGIGFCGHYMMSDGNPTAEASVVSNGYNYFYNVNDETETVAYTFQAKIAVPMTFSAIFDNVMVWTSAQLNDGTELTDFNVIKISADGQTVENAGYAEANFTAVSTASSWFDEDETEVYYLSDAKDEFPEWLTYGVDNSAWTDYDPETENPGPDVYVGFEAEALPEGVTGRGVKLYVNGRGIVSEDPIYVLQGDYTKEQCDEAETGVNSVLAPKTFDGKTYNVAGQRVSNSFNGIVIKNGKKFLNK